MDAVDQALDAVYAAVCAEREAHQTRIGSELDAIAGHLTETLLPPEMRAAGIRLEYDTKGLK